MPTVPLIQRQVNTQALGAPQLREVSGFAQAAQQRASAFGPLVEGGNNLVNSLQQISAKRQDEADTVQVMNADREMNGWINRFMFDPQQGALNRKGLDSLPLPEDFNKQYQEQLNTMSSSLTPKQQQVFQRMAMQRQMTTGSQLQRYVSEQMTAHRTESVEAYQGQQVQNAQLYFNDRNMVDDAARMARNSVMTTPEYAGADSYRQGELVQKAEGPVLYGALSQMVNRDPRRAVEFYESVKDRLGPDLLAKADSTMKTLGEQQQARTLVRRVFAKAPTSDSEMAGYIMDKLEGGSRVVDEPGGGVAKYGINSLANPDVDVRNLTREQAQQIYLHKYLPDADKALQATLSGTGEPVAVPTDLRFLAFDTVINHGEGNGTQLISQSGGDPLRLLDLREAEYRRLAAADPAKYGGQLSGWLGRLDSLRSTIGGQQVDNTDPAAVMGYLTANAPSQDVADLAFKGYSDTLKAQEESRRLGRANLSEEVNGYVAQGQEPPTEVLDRFRKEFPEDYLKWATGGNTANPQMVEQTRNRILAGESVDLSGMRYQLGDQFDKLQQLQTSPDKMEEALRIDQVVKRYTPTLIDKQNASTGAEAASVENFRAALTSELQSRIKAGGQMPSAQDIEGIAASLSLDVGGVGANRLYDYSGTDKVLGVTLGSTYRISGSARGMTGRELISSVSAALSRSGTAVTVANIQDYISALRSQGQINGN